jgi:hypothetical protein
MTSGEEVIASVLISLLGGFQAHRGMRKALMREAAKTVYLPCRIG